MQDKSRYRITAYDPAKRSGHAIARLPAVVKTFDQTGKVIDEKETTKQLRVDVNGAEAAVETIKEWLGQGYLIDVRLSGGYSPDQHDMTPLLLALLGRKLPASSD